MGRLWTFGKRLNTELTDGRIRDNTDGKRCGLNISYKKLSTGLVILNKFSLDTEESLLP